MHHRPVGLGSQFAEGKFTPEMRTALAGALKGRLLAWNPVTQKPAWSVEYGGPLNGGTLATAGGLVFQGTASGEFFAYDARDGTRLWRFATQAGVMAGPVSYTWPADSNMSRYSRAMAVAARSGCPYSAARGRD